MLVQDLMDDFRRFMKARDFSPRTQESYAHQMTVLRERLGKYLGKPLIEVADLSRKTLQDFFDHAVEHNVNTATIRCIANALRCFFRLLITKDLVTNNVASSLEIPREHRCRRPLLREEDALLILKAPMKFRRLARCGRVQVLRDATLLSLMYEGGLRRAELTSLNVGSLYFDSPRKGTCMLQFTGKGRKARTVLVMRSCELLTQYLAVRKEQNHGLCATDPLFPNMPRGGRIGESTIGSIVKKWARAAGVCQNVHPHMFRAACATHMRWRGADRRAIQDHLGHASPVMTEWYCHGSPDLQIDQGLIYHPLNKREAKEHPRDALNKALSQLEELGRRLDRTE